MGPKGISTFFFLSVLYLTLIYSNTLSVPFLFDDTYNILDRPELKLTRFTPDAVADTFFKGKNLYRPISCFSFALNYYIGNHRLPGYHIVNLLIHCITTFFLFKTILLLLDIGKSSLHPEEKYLTACLSTILWATHPIQTQAVTYIVQRMASLAAMFYIIGLFGYIHCRLFYIQSNRNRSFKWFLISILSFSAGVLSKENAVVFPMAVLLIELFFFDGYVRIRRNFLLLIGLLVSFSILIYFLFDNSLQNLFSGYQVRPFTLSQRLLTEPRILFFYIFQLIYPIPSHFSLTHYIPVSTSIFNPLTTIISISGIVIAIILALVLGRKHPLLTFPIVFYFFHHAVESGIIPLELIYEHRNYLPSFFFFLPFSIGLIKLLNYYRSKNRVLWGFLLVFVSNMIFFLGLSSYIRNNDWQSYPAFWKHELVNAPELVRPYLGMGWYYTQESGLNLNLANHYFNIGVTKIEYSTIFEIADLWSNIAKINEERQDYPSAIYAEKTCLDIYHQKILELPNVKNRKDVRENLSLAYKQIADTSAFLNPKDCLGYIEKAIQLNDSPYFYNEKALYLIKNQEYGAALQAIQNSFKNTRDNQDAFFIAAYLFTQRGDYAKGLWYYRQYLEIENADDSRQSIVQPVLLFMADNRYLAGDWETGDQYLKKFVQTGSLPQIFSIIRKFQNNYPKTLPLLIDHNILTGRLNQIICQLTERSMGEP